MTTSYVTNPASLSVVHSIGNFNELRTPPAHEASANPSSSESILIKISPETLAGSRAMTPSIPVSSSVVTNTVKAGCSNVSSAKIASDMATAIPLSAPSVVPFVRNQSPST